MSSTATSDRPIEMGKPRPYFISCALLLFAATATLCFGAGISSLPSLPSVAVEDNGSTGGIAAPRASEQESGSAEGYTGTSETQKGTEGVRVNKNRIAYDRIDTRIDSHMGGQKPVDKKISNLGEGRPKAKAGNDKETTPLVNQAKKWGSGINRVESR
jgi:hypothetical protein